MSQLITPEELPRWVPGVITDTSDGLGWQGVALRGYNYLGQDVHIPPVRDYLIVTYKLGQTPMERRFEGSWTRTRCAPGCVSLHTRAQRSHWNWSNNIDVTHLYLTEDLLSRLASEALDRNGVEVHLQDLLNVEDPMIVAAADAIRREARQQALGGSLYVEAVGSQLALHLLRHYSSVTIREINDNSRLSQGQAKRIVEYIDSHLDSALEVKALAEVLGLGVWSFNRRFRETFGCAAYAFVLNRRLERARDLIEHGSLPLKHIALCCGFTDQAHMTRLCKARLGTTPDALRREARR